MSITLSLTILLSALAGLGVGVIFMLQFYVRPLVKQVMTMRIAGFDPVRPRPERRVEDNLLNELNET